MIGLVLPLGLVLMTGRGTAQTAALCSLHSVFAAELIAWMTTNQREERSRAEEHAVGLRKAGREFADEVRGYCDNQLKEDASATELRRQRGQFDTHLMVTKLLKPEWPAPDLLSAELATFVHEVEQEWRFDNDRRELGQRAAEARRAVRELDRRPEVVVQALQRLDGSCTLHFAEFGAAATR